MLSRQRRQSNYPATTRDHIRQRTLGRRIRAAWEQFCTGYEPPTPAEAAADHALVAAELEAGAAAFLAGIAEGDAILTKLGRQGYANARRQWNNGRRLARTDILAKFPSQWGTWTAATRQGYEAGRMEASIARHLQTAAGAP
jgi:hypothetical protein